MKRTLALTIAACALAVLASVAPGSTQKTCNKTPCYVQVGKCDGYEIARFLARKVFTLTYTQDVAVVKRSERWFYVRPHGEGVIGWVHDSALTRQELLLGPPEKKLKRRERGEDELAGRAFQDDIEREIRQRKKDFEDGYERLDAVGSDSSLVPSFEQIDLFRNEGGLQPLGEEIEP